MTNYVLADSGFWFALYNQRDPYFERAQEIADLVLKQKVVIPWPSLYEIINTRFARNRSRMCRFESLIKQPNINFIDDLIYKNDALEYTFEYSKVGKRYSLVDSVIREILKDSNVKIDYLITFNDVDFIDLCQIRKIEIFN